MIADWQYFVSTSHLLEVENFNLVCRRFHGPDKEFQKILAQFFLHVGIN